MVATAGGICMQAGRADGMGSNPIIHVNKMNNGN